jgi:hypothetical protein
MLSRPAMLASRACPRAVMAVRRLCDAPKADSLHSSDIAFKPTEDGWGYTNRYASGWDRIFAKAGGDESPAAAQGPAAATDQGEAAASLLKQQEEVLSTAHACGALSDALYAQAKLELKK